VKTLEFWSPLEKDIKKRIHVNEISGASLRLGAQELDSVAFKLDQDWGFFFLLDIWVEDLLDEQAPHRFRVNYELYNLEVAEKLRLIVEVNDGDTIESVQRIWPSAKPFEDEIRSDFGLFCSVKDRNNFIMRKDFCFERRNITKIEVKTKPEGWINISMDNTLIGGHLEISAQTKKDSLSEIAKIEVESGYQYRGIEKLLEGKKINDVLPILERVDLSSGIFYSTLFCEIVEAHTGLIVPERAQAIRMIYLEIGRIFQHLGVLRNMASEANYSKMLATCLVLRKEMLLFCDHTLKTRYFSRALCFGGVNTDLEIGWSSSFHDLLGLMEGGLDELTLLTRRSREWMGRTVCKHTSPHSALSYGVTGPNLRATGVNFDLRKIKPKYFYGEINFEIPLGINGDLYDRCLVRVEEIRQSVIILYQLADNLPSGEIQQEEKFYGVTPQSSFDLINKLAGPGSFIHIPSGTFADEIESANGILSLKFSSHGDNSISRFRMRPPSISHLHFFENEAIGLTLAELPPFYSSLNICLNEVDR
jgi:NADH-quinone oxidoreductase subunit C/D